MRNCVVQSQLNDLRNRIRMAAEPDSPGLISLWLQLDRCCDQERGVSVCQICSKSVQRHCYEQQFYLLLETIMDDLLPSHWRCTCLDNIYKPLSNLRLLSDCQQSKDHVRGLSYELFVSSHYVRSALVF